MFRCQHRQAARVRNELTLWIYKASCYCADAAAAFSVIVAFAFRGDTNAGNPAARVLLHNWLLQADS